MVLFSGKDAAYIGEHRAPTAAEKRDSEYNTYALKWFKHPATALSVLTHELFDIGKSVAKDIESIPVIGPMILGVSEIGTVVAAPAVIGISVVGDQILGGLVKLERKYGNEAEIDILTEATKEAIHHPSRSRDEEIDSFERIKRRRLEAVPTVPEPISDEAAQKHAEDHNTKETTPPPDLSEPPLEPMHPEPVPTNVENEHGFSLAKKNSELAGHSRNPDGTVRAYNNISMGHSIAAISLTDGAHNPTGSQISKPVPNHNSNYSPYG